MIGKSKKLSITGTEGQSFHNLIAGFDDRFGKVLEEIKFIIKPNSLILDIGCGEGKIWKEFRNYKIYGVDNAKENLKKAKKFLKPILSDATKLPFKKNTFDLVVASEIFEHVFYPDLVLSEIDRVLKKGGFSIISFPSTSGIQFRLCLLLFGRCPGLNYPENVAHIRFFNLYDFKNMLQDTHLIITKVRGCSFFAFHEENFGVYCPFPKKFRMLGGDLFPSLSLGNIVVLKKN